MGFLDEVKKKNEEAGPAAKPAIATKPNPLASKTTPLTKKTETEPEAPKKTLSLLSKKEDTKAPAAAAATTTPVAKPNPFGPKKTILKEEPVEEVKEEVAATPVEETTEEKTVEEVASEPETSIVEDIKEESVTVTVEESAEVVVKTEVVEDKKPAPKGKGGGKKTAAKTEEVKAKESAKTEAITDIPTTSISYAEAMLSITSPFVDEEWENYKEEIQGELDVIVIEDDMNAATLKSAISSLSKLRNKVWNNYQAIRSQYESLSSKEPEGLIERIKRINLGDATNDMQRKKAGVEACMNYLDKENNLINLYEILDETRSRYHFLRAVMDSIEYKRSVLVTMNGALKIEKDLGPAE